MGIRSASFSHIKRYYDAQRQCVTAKLLPGEFYVTDKDEVIGTVLGSCVAACLYDSQAHCGGMNHFMLPGMRGSGDGDASARYGLFAMESLLNELLKLGCRKERLRAKLFGGAQIVRNMSDVGQKNIHFARHFLHAEGIALESSDLGSIYPRKVHFFAHSGKALVKRLNSLQESVEHREIEYLQRISHKPVAGSIELF
ncbi:MAG TPA: chemoreceptor glutamine deamidase CheD [Hyphomicrobiales bacterium]|nr:chemoreceptor glutamine deamidase CheD [Hyphomicrobiales bacterium]